MSNIGFAIMLFLTSLSLSCSSASATLLPTTENRTLWPDPDKPGLFYNHYECAKKNIFGGCKEWTMKTDHYDLTDAAVRKEIIDMGVVCKVRPKLLP